MNWTKPRKPRVNHPGLFRYNDTHYLLGMAYLETDQPDMAAREFQSFLERYQEWSGMEEMKEQVEAELLRLQKTG